MMGRLNVVCRPISDSDVVGALADLESGALTALPDPDPAGTGDDGPGDEEGGQDRGQLLEGHIAPHEVVLVGP